MQTKQSELITVQSEIKLKLSKTFIIKSYQHKILFISFIWFLCRKKKFIEFNLIKSDFHEKK